MKKKLLILFFLASQLTFWGQDIPQHISYTRIYDFLDELAGDNVIEINSVVKPYSRIFITQQLLVAKSKINLLNDRQQADLKFFLNEFSLEQNKLPDTHLTLRKTQTSTVALIQPAFHYRDSLFRSRISPILGMSIAHNKNGNITKRWYGAEFQGMIGKHLSVFGSIRDYSFTGGLLAGTQYLNDFPGCEYTNKKDGDKGDYSDFRGGIKFGWNWGSVGLVKDNLVWGDNYHGANILSGRAPSFPMLQLNLKPAKWFELNYIHGWLVSNVVDSTRYYEDNTGAHEYRMKNKFIAANMLTFRPIKQLNISLGNSIIYAESNIQAAYLIPIAFYKSLDHSMTKGITNLENQNSQVFFNISSRNIKHLHLFTSVYFDEVSFARFKPSSKEQNPVSIKIGGALSNFPVQNLTFIGEFTRTNIINYKHSVPALSYASNGYNLGHYLGDNSQEIYLALRYKPIRGLDLNLSYMDAKHGNEYDYLRRDSQNTDAIKRIISQKVLDEIIWTNKTLSFDAKYEVFSNAYAIVNIAYSNIQGHDKTKPRIEGENKATTAQEFLDLFTPSYLQGKNTTITVGFSLGF